MPQRLPRLLPLLLILALPLAAQPPASPPDAGVKAPEAKEKEKKPAPPPPEDKLSRTQHTITIDGQKIAYTATAGTTVLKDEDGTAKATVFSIAYVKDGVKDPATRPVTFCFNGGPGAASLWVHLGAFGPKRVERDDEGMPASAPPGRLIDNDQSLLDLTDLVFIDPVSTGYSRPVQEQDPKQFHGVREDIEWVAKFIRLWVTRNERWASPKFIAGESYGTTRAAGLAFHLQDRYGMELNGVVLVSSVLNWQNQEFHVGNDMPYIIHLPTYAATAWYHKKLPPELSRDLGATLREVEDFARNEYAQALMQGDRLPAERRHEIAAKVARYTGLSQDYVERSNLRIEIYRFTKELLRGEGKTVGRLDTRFTGTDLDAVGEQFEYDPASVSLDGPYAAAINDYLRRDLGFKEDLVYERLAQVWPWSWTGFQNQYVNMAEYLRGAITRNPRLRVLVASGHFDLATPYFDAFYTVDHLGLPEALRGNVKIATYEAGHMMYIRRADHRKLKADIAEPRRRGAFGPLGRGRAERQQQPGEVERGGEERVRQLLPEVPHVADHGAVEQHRKSALAGILAQPIAQPAGRARNHRGGDPRHLLAQERRDWDISLREALPLAQHRPSALRIGLRVTRSSQQQPPHSQPMTTKKSPAPLFHAATKRVRDELYGAYSRFVAAFREASEKWRSGDLKAYFPDGCFPPAPGFVGG